MSVLSGGRKSPYPMPWRPAPQLLAALLGAALGAAVGCAVYFGLVWVWP